MLCGVQVEAAGAGTPSRLRTTSARGEDSTGGTDGGGPSGQEQSPSLEGDEADGDEAEQVLGLRCTPVPCLKLEGHGLPVCSFIKWLPRTSAVDVDGGYRDLACLQTSPHNRP